MEEFSLLFLLAIPVILFFAWAYSWRHGGKKHRRYILDKLLQAIFQFERNNNFKVSLCQEVGEEKQKPLQWYFYIDLVPEEQIMEEHGWTRQQVWEWTKRLVVNVLEEGTIQGEVHRMCGYFRGYAVYFNYADDRDIYPAAHETRVQYETVGEPVRYPKQE